MTTMTSEDRLRSIMSGAGKTDAYKSDQSLQGVLWRTNDELRDLETELTANLPDASENTIIIVAFAPRSGSTLLTQLLAKSGLCSYISNLQARFYHAPWIGGMIEKTLYDRTKLDFPLESDYGKTALPNAPNEFRYFWVKWFPFWVDDAETLPRERWGEIDTEGLKRELNAIRSLYPMPIHFKKEWLAMNGSWFIENIPNVKVIHVERDPLFTAQSIYKARADVFGSHATWWAGKPSNYHELKDKDPFTQVAGQIRGINDDIDRVKREHPEVFMTFAYEDMITDTHGYMKRVLEFCGAKNLEIDEARVPKSLERRNRQKVSDAELDGLKSALRDFKLL